MNENGVHSLLNAIKSTVSDEYTASLVQTVASKDLSNTLMAVNLPKSEEEGPSSQLRKRLPKLLIQGEVLRKKGTASKKKKK